MLPPFAGLRFSWPDGRKYDGQWSLLTCCASLRFLVVSSSSALCARVSSSILIFSSSCIASHHVARRDGKQHGTGSYVGMPNFKTWNHPNRRRREAVMCKGTAGQRLWNFIDVSSCLNVHLCIMICEPFDDIRITICYVNPHESQAHWPRVHSWSNSKVSLAQEKKQGDSAILCFTWC